MIAQGLIDITEMYLRTFFGLAEEAATPLRARIAERPGQTGPAVSQTVPRREREGLVHVLMHEFSRAGIQPEREVILVVAGDDVRVTAGDSADVSVAEFAGSVAAHIFVSEPSR